MSKDVVDFFRSNYVIPYHREKCIHVFKYADLRKETMKAFFLSTSSEIK